MVTFEQVELYYRAAFLKATNPDSYAEYYEGSYHRPHWKPGGAIKPQLSASYRTTSLLYVTPRKGREYTEMELPIDYTRFDALATTQSMPKFICITMKPGSYPFYIYGWIDSVEPIATKGPRQNTLIKWHVDYWLTISAFNYLRNANPAQYGQRYAVTFANGRVKRGPASIARPDPSAPRLWEYAASTNIVRDINGTPDANGPYVIVMYTKTTTIGSDTYTHLVVAFWGTHETITGANSPPTNAQVYAGKLEEVMGIAPSAIVGVWYSPIQPNFTVGVVTNTYDNVTYGWHEYDPGVQPPQAYTIILSNTPISTNDEEKYLVMDPMGTVYATLPWMLKFDRVIAYVDIGTSGAWLHLYFKNGSTGTDSGEGRRMQIPLIAAPVTSNAKSDYILSGQEEYDRTMARIQQQQNLLSGVAGSGTSLIGGAVAGSMVAPGAGTVAGAIGGFGSGLIGAGVNYWIQGDADRKSREAYDKLMSNQIANVIITAGGIAWIYHSEYRWKIVKLTRDSTSAAELTGEQTELGYVTDAFTTNAGLLIAAGGPLRIEGLQIDGDISPEGKLYIQAMFARGVHLDLIQ